VLQETILWDAAEGETRSMRGKEESHDYRYFPEPDLLPLVLTGEWIEEVRAELPELPAERKTRFLEQYALPEAEAHLLTLEGPLADYFEEVALLSSNPRLSSNFVLNDLQREQKGAGRSDEEVPLPAARLAELIRLVDANTLSLSAARGLFEEIYRTGRPAAELVREKGLEQISDVDALRDVVRGVMEAHPQQLAQYRAGKTATFGFFVGQVMRATGGRGNPQTVNSLLREMLG
jgi:aspartyl-tRNA(Asn)/glutamyl-tRNA(Gln) amidotransferase subunit B